MEMKIIGTRRRTRKRFTRNLFSTGEHIQNSLQVIKARDVPAYMKSYTCLAKPLVKLALIYFQVLFIQTDFK